MKQVETHGLTLDELIERFVAIGLKQDEALLMGEIATFNRLFRSKTVLLNELKSRAGDQRRALLKLYEHPNAQVRLNAVKATLAVAPEAARQKLHEIAKSGDYPQAGDAGMTIDNLELGIFRPE